MALTLSRGGGLTLGMPQAFRKVPKVPLLRPWMPALDTRPSTQEMTWEVQGGDGRKHNQHLSWP